MRTPAKSPQAKEVNELVEGLQAYFVSKLNAVALEFGEANPVKQSLGDVAMNVRIS